MSLLREATDSGAPGVVVEITPEDAGWDRAGLRVLLLSARLAEARFRSALRALAPRAVVICGSEARLGLLAHPDDLIPVRSHSDQRDRHAGVVGDRLEVVAGLLRQVRLAAAVADVVYSLSCICNGDCNRSGVGSAKKQKAIGKATSPARRQPNWLITKPSAASASAITSHQSKITRGPT